MTARGSRAGRVGSGLLAMAGIALASAVLTTVAAPGAATAGTSAAEPNGSPTTSSAVTLSGRGAFSDLKVTVGQTTNLANQVVSVNWTGGQPTRGNFAVNYLQIMQCWGDDPAGPDREQCQYGGLVGEPRGGAQVTSRQVTYTITDPLETLKPQQPNQIRFVPFRSVTGKRTEAALSEFFDASTTNEVPFARTGADGTGAVAFEVQTAAEAPGLGCGAPPGAKRAANLPSQASPAATPRSPAAAPAAPGPAAALPPITPPATGTAVTTRAATGTAAGPPPRVVPPVRPKGPRGRACWLVIVPRGTTEVNGSARTEDSTNQLLSSPLASTNWAQRLVVPLDFATVGQPCPLGRAERPVVGHESAVEAVSSWQPALCARSGPIFSYSQIPDATARRQAFGDAPALSVVGRAAAATEVPAGRKPVYAPVAVSGLVIAFNIESQAAFQAPEAVTARNGQRLTELNLTPRLVTKLLTQSYRLGAAQDRPGITTNPLDLTRDPEFLALNPAFAQLRFAGIADMLMPAGSSDAVASLWQWILADPEARSFIAGTPDAAGAVINPAYKGIGQQDGLPKSDPVCQKFPNKQPQLCTLDAHPYAADTHEAARAAARGDTLARSFFDAAALPAVYRKQAPQPSGSRALLALTDSATAARFGLQTARLRTAGSAGFAAADQAGLLAGLALMKKSAVPAVLEPAGNRGAGIAYPLTQLSYAVSAPAALQPAARKDYATFLRYAAGPGQTPGIAPGRLPPGYAPLPATLRAQTTSAATAIATTVGGADTGAGATGAPLGTSAASTGSVSTGTAGTGTAGTGLVSTGTAGTGTAGTGAAGTGIAGTGLPAGGASADSGGLTPGAVVPPGSGAGGALPIGGAAHASAAGAVAVDGTAPAAGTGAAAESVPRPQTAPTPEASAPTVVLTAGLTPEETPGIARFALPIALALGGFAALAGPGLRRRAIHAAAHSTARPSTATPAR